MGLAVAAELPGRVDRCLGRRPTPSYSIILPSILAHMAARAASESLSAARSGIVWELYRQPQSNARS